MKMKKEKLISEYIDILNREQAPGKDIWEENEMPELTETIRKLKGLKDPEYPGKDFERKLADTTWKAYQEKDGYKNVTEAAREKKTAGTQSRRRSYLKPAFWGVGAAAAVFLGVLYFRDSNQFINNPVYAMEQAYEEAGAYHGILTITSINQEGEKNLQAEREVWADKEGRYYVKELEGMNKGLITVNNGAEKWQLDETDKYIGLYEAFPDNYSFTFEIGKEVDEIQKANEVTEMGKETVSGHESVLYLITPKGGDSYKLWVDAKNGLPLKKQTAVSNGISYEMSYQDISYEKEIPAANLSYGDLSGYTVNRDENWQICATMEEAQSLAGITSKLPTMDNTSYSLASIGANAEEQSIKVYFTLKGQDNKISIIEKAAVSGDETAAGAITGTIGSYNAEIIKDAKEEEGKAVGSFGEQTGLTSIRWQQDGREYRITGNGSMDEMNVFIKALAGTEAVIAQAATDAPEVKVDYDIEVEEATQKEVDGGHQPWKLDPAFVAQVFTSLLISPEGITGDYPIPYEDFKVVENDGSSVVIAVENEKSPVSKVYLKQLVRQDSTGIWTVVGYDKAKNK